MTPRTEIDRDKLKAYVKRVGSSITAGYNCAISSLGDRLGLYQALRELRIASSEDLAHHTGLNERWIREWLRHQACVEQVEYDSETDRFWLSPEAVAVLLDDSMPTYLAGGFDGVVATMPSLPGLVESFRTGIGRTYDDHGAGCACGIERLSSHGRKFQLVPNVLPLVDGIVARLESGIRVADVGCGGALATIAMAKAFPRSTFVGYDNSAHALERARGNAKSSEATNVEFVNPDTNPMPDRPAFDLITTFDVVHDVAYPQRLIAAIHDALMPDGIWLCEDIRSLPSFDENLRENRYAAMLYGFSIMVCMASGLSKADGAGLGTLGFNETVARQMTQAAGFTRFRRLDYDNPFNSYYEIRK
jgi:2-polyprenyl-3-methyl-5-hydroxy-6-metoxy-1,4-benzoquinol methylase